MLSKHAERIVLVFLILLNLALKLSWLGVNELAHDEPFTVVMAHNGLSRMFDLLSEENNPPLFFLLLKAWCAVTPLDASWLRVPSALFSALTVWPIFLLGRRWGDLRTAVTAGLLFTFSNYHYGFAHEVRAYALFTLLATTSMWVLARSTVPNISRNRIIATLTTLNVLMVYTHFFGWLIIGVQGLCVVLWHRLHALRRPYCWAAALTVLAYAPYARIFFGRIGQSVSQGTWLEPPHVEELYNMVWRWSNAPVIALSFMMVITTVLLLVRTARQVLLPAILWSVVPLVGMFLLSIQVPIFLDRYLVFAAPGFALLVALSIGQLPGGHRVNMATSSIAVIGMAWTFTPWKGHGLRPSAVVAQVNAWREKDTPVLLHPWYYMDTYAWHTDPQLVRVPERLQSDLAEALIFPIGTLEQLPPTLTDRSSVVFVDAGAGLGDVSRTIGTLRAEWPLLDSAQVDRKVRVYRFRR